MTNRRTIVSALAGAVAALGLRTTRAQGEGTGSGCVRAIPTSDQCHRPTGVLLSDIFPDEVCTPGQVRANLDARGGGLVGLYYHDTDCCIYSVPQTAICREA